MSQRRIWVGPPFEREKEPGLNFAAVFFSALFFEEGGCKIWILSSVIVSGLESLFFIEATIVISQMLNVAPILNCTTPYLKKGFFYSNHHLIFGEI